MTTGRPREFDPNTALDRALKVFWKKGYEGASLLDLTRAMGINRPSMYAAFGNKEALFRKTIDRYAEKHALHVREALAEPTAHEVAKYFLCGAVDLVCNARNPRGCFLVQGALACGDAGETMRREMSKRRAAVEAGFRDRFIQAQADGDLPSHADAAALARYLTSISHGLSVHAASGASREELLEVVNIALLAWPTES